MARKLGVYQQLIQKWVAGDYTPKTFHALMLHEAYGVPPEAWLTPRQRTALEALRRSREDGTVQAARDALERVSPAPTDTKTLPLFPGEP